MYYDPFESEYHDKCHFNRYGHVMIDLETLSLKTNASIVSIAAVEFNPRTGRIGETFFAKIKPSEWGKNGRDIDGETIKWWLDRDKDASKLLSEADDKKDSTLKRALERLTEFINKCDKHNLKEDNGERVNVWGNGSITDITMLQSAYEYFGMETPWRYWAVNDVRTIVNLNPGVKKRCNENFEGVKHNPIDDCRHQIKYLSQTLQTVSINNKYSINLSLIKKHYADDLVPLENCLCLFENGYPSMTFYKDGQDKLKIWLSNFNSVDVSSDNKDDIPQYYNENCFFYDEIKIISIDDWNAVMKKMLAEEAMENIANGDSDNTYKRVNEDVKDYGGQYVSFGKEKGILVAATATVEDLYYAYLDENLELKYTTCLDTIKVLPQEDCPKILSNAVIDPKYDIIKKFIMTELDNLTAEVAFTPVILNREKEEEKNQEENSDSL